MRLMHLSDLHLGKIVNGFSMLEDQEYILNQILDVADEQEVRAVLLCGDIYDRPVPPEEAVRLFDGFLTELAKRDLPVFIISGNHDSAQRLAFGAHLMEEEQIYLAGILDGVPQPVVLEDEYGEIAFYLLPFVKPVHVRKICPDVDPESLRTYQDALAWVIGQMEVEESRRNVILAHQFVTGAVRSESETVNVGGTDNIDASLFDRFDYAALGHIHRPQQVGRPGVRYCGTPLKYSFTEAGQEKNVTIVDLKEKGTVEFQTVALHPLRDMREIQGSYEELTLRENYIGTNTEDYLHISLTDEEDIIDVMMKLRTIYPNIMKLDYRNRRSSQTQEVHADEETQQKSPLELVREFYLIQNNREMNEQQSQYMKKLLEEM